MNYVIGKDIKVRIEDVSVDLMICCKHCGIETERTRDKLYIIFHIPKDDMKFWSSWIKIYLKNIKKRKEKKRQEVKE